MASSTITVIGNPGATYQLEITPEAPRISVDRGTAAGGAQPTITVQGAPGASYTIQIDEVP